jgi:hypothetical protein
MGARSTAVPSARETTPKKGFKPKEPERVVVVALPPLPSDPFERARVLRQRARLPARGMSSPLTPALDVRASRVEMTDPKTAIVDVEGTAEAVGAVLEKVPVYPDAIQPAAKEIGKTLALPFAVVNAALRPVKSVIAAIEIAFDDLDKRVAELLRAVPPEKVVEPPANVAGPLLLAYPFVRGEPPLREMFEQLLATAMNADTAGRAHPSYVEIVRQLTSDEARLLRRIHHDHETCAAIGRIDRVLANNTFAREAFSTPLYEELPPSAERRVMHRYLDNIRRLGIIEIQFGSPLVGHDAEYGAMRQDVERAASKSSDKNGYLVLIRGSLRMTSFGNAFLQACVGPRSK